MKLHQLLQAIQFGTNVCIIHDNCEYTLLYNSPMNPVIVLNESTFEDVKNIFPDADFKQFYNEATGIFEITDGIYTEYTINNVVGELRFDFDENDKLIHVLFSPKDYSKDSGDALKTWVFNKYSDYEQTTKDTGFVFTNGVEDVELYITENPVDNTKYHGLYIEWNVVE